MNDPYNSYGSQVAPMTAEAVEAKASRPPPDPIARANVSETWKRRFRLIRQAGGADLPDLRSLTFGDRFSVHSNILAWFFGPIYYVIKGLYRQALAYTVLGIAGIIVFHLIGLDRHLRFVGACITVAYGLRANVSYYRLMIDGEPRWL